MTGNENITSGKKFRILVVDDEANILEILKSFLEGEGYDVSTAGNGLDAINAVDSDCPDVILLDIRMPDMDGLQCLRMTKRKSANGRCCNDFRVCNSKHRRANVSKLGAFDYISKPFCFPHITDVIQKIKITKYLEYI